MDVESGHLVSDPFHLLTSIGLSGGQREENLK
jgi:hypothetical protein